MQHGTINGPFDAALSQFGVMFFDEPVTAFTNIGRALARGRSHCVRVLASGRAQPMVRRVLDRVVSPFGRYPGTR